MIDEYDFYEARYRGDEAGPEPLPGIRIEVVLTGLVCGDERFRAALSW